jgi:hypothetical protein
MGILDSGIHDLGSMIAGSSTRLLDSLVGNQSRVVLMALIMAMNGRRAAAPGLWERITADS